MTRRVLLPPIQTPSAAEVEKYLGKWHAADNERIDTALRALFQAPMWARSVSRWQR